MGLIKAAMGAVGGTLGDQWKEFFTCESLDADTLVAKGCKKTSDRSSNTSGESNVITNGSKIAVADGQCMMIVDQGKVVEVCAEPGEYTFDQSSEPTIFSGGLGDGLENMLHTMADRFTFGGIAAKDQRIYYFNTKEIMGNKYGTPQPVPFRVVDQRAGIDMDIAIRCFGEYSYRIVNPVLFYTNVCANVEDYFTRDEIDSQLKSELMTALQPAFGKISAMGIRYSELTMHTHEIADALNEQLSNKWGNTRGIKVVSFGVNSVSADEEDARMIKEMQRNAAYMDPTRAAAAMVGAQAQAMQTAAGNAGGAAIGFMGMNMAQGAGGVNAAQLFNMGAQQQAQQPQVQQAAPQPAAGGWTCACGTQNTGKFCANCGKPKPAEAGGWTCGCGTQNTGKFCSNCGKPRPDAEWTCKCGTVNKGKFCSNCGQPRG